MQKKWEITFSSYNKTNSTEPAEMQKKKEIENKLKKTTKKFKKSQFCLHLIQVLLYFEEKFSSLNSNYLILCVCVLLDLCDVEFGVSCIFVFVFHLVFFFSSAPSQSHSQLIPKSVHIYILRYFRCRLLSHSFTPVWVVSMSQYAVSWFIYDILTAALIVRSIWYTHTHPYKIHPIIINKKRIGLKSN